MAVPYTFGSATTSIPLSQLDSNFATPITLGNTAIQLGNTVTTLNNMTLANVTISSGNISASILTSGTVPSARQPAGSVLQVVQTVTTATLNFSNTSFAATGFGASITPTSASSKVYVFVNGLFSSAYNNNFGYAKMYRNASGIGQGFFLGSELYQPNGGRTTAQFSYQYLDSPASTSAQSYELYVHIADGNNGWINRWAQDTNWTQPLVITLMEIAA